MSDETKLRECKTLAKLIAIGDSTAGADLCQRVDKAADLIASLQSQLSQALRELDAARSHSSALLRDVELAEAQRDQALRELGEARADLKAWIDQSYERTAERDAALRSTAELTRERDEAIAELKRLRHGI